MTDGPGWYGLMGPPPRPGGRPGFSIIRPALLVGEYPTPADAAWLRAEQGVTAVLCLQDDADLASKNVRLAVLENAYRTAGVGFHRIPVPDGHDLDLGARLGEIVDLLRRLVAAGERVYLHCNAGFNRAPTAAIAYLHACEGLTLAAARDLVKQCRPCVPYMRALETHFGLRKEIRVGSDRERVLAAHLRAENEHDLDGIMATFRPDATLVLNGQTFTGTDIIRRAHAALGFGERGGFSDLRVEEVKRHAAPSAIVLEERLSGRHTGTWEGVAATGRTFEVPLCTVYQFAADGLLEAEHVYFDSALLLKQLGAAP